MLSHFTEYHENISGVPVTCHIIRLLLVWNPIFLWGPLAVPCSDDPGRMGGPCNIDNASKSHMDLLPDTQHCGLRMRRECLVHFPCHRLQWKPLVNDPGMHHGTCITHVPWCMSGSLTRGGGENVPGIPGACATNSVSGKRPIGSKFVENVSKIHFINQILRQVILRMHGQQKRLVWLNAILG